MHHLLYNLEVPILKRVPFLFSGLAVFAMQVKCLLVGFHTVLNHSVLKNSGPCKGLISKKLLLQINVPFYKITPTVSGGGFFHVSDIYMSTIYTELDILPQQG